MMIQNIYNGFWDISKGVLQRSLTLYIPSEKVYKRFEQATKNFVKLSLHTKNWLTVY